MADADKLDEQAEEARTEGEEKYDALSEAADEVRSAEEKADDARE